MSYADRLQKLVEYQNSIRSALTEKGATISSDSTFKDFPAAVGTITGDYDGPTPVDFAENGMAAYLSMMSNATRIASYAFVGARISEVNFPYCSVVGEYAFSNCTSLSYVNLPECKSILVSTFHWCTSLNNISAPKCSYMGSMAFGFCRGLKSIDFPKLISGEAELFSGCSNLKSANLPRLQFAFSTFRGCYGLVDVNMPEVSYLSAMVFNGCSYLESLNFNSLKNISCGTYATTFGGCFNLRSLYIKSPSVCTLSTSYAFSATPILGVFNSTYCTKPGVYGSVFVPYSLINSYREATNWTYLSSRIAGLVNLSVTNLSEGDTITTVVDGKVFSDEMEVPDTTFTYSVYSKYPKYTGSQDDVGENSSINIALPTDGVKLTVNTTPEDAVVTITEDGFAEITTKEKTGSVGNTLLVRARKRYYKPYESTITMSEDKIMNIELEAGTLPEDITADNAAKYSTWVDGENFEISDGFIRSGSKSYNVNNGFSVGFVKIYAEIDCKMKIRYKISSQYNGDYGVILIGNREYEFDRDTSLVYIPEGFIQILKISDTLIKNEKDTNSVALSAGEEYYIYFIYTKNSSLNYGNDRFYIRSVTFSE